MSDRLTVLCLASYHKGIDLLRELRRQDCTVLLVTSKSLEDAEWPRDSIDGIFYKPDVDKQWDARDTLTNQESQITAGDACPSRASSARRREQSAGSWPRRRAHR